MCGPMTMCRLPGLEKMSCPSVEGDQLRYLCRSCSRLPRALLRTLPYYYIQNTHLRIASLDCSVELHAQRSLSKIGTLHQLKYFSYFILYISILPSNISHELRHCYSNDLGPIVHRIVENVTRSGEQVLVVPGSQ